MNTAGAIPTSVVDGPPVLVTRPAMEAGPWVDGLRRQGLDARALPLIEIASAPDATALQAARAALGSLQAAMFVSANAVRGLLPPGSTWPAGVRAWATGPGTRRALLEAGVPAAQVDAPDAEAAQFDSEALWALVRSQVGPGARVLIARGGDAQGLAAGRPWLAQQLAQAGVQVDTCVTYRRRLPAWTGEQRALAEAAAAGTGWWIFSSTEAVDNLRALLPGRDLHAARALCTHARIEEAARALGVGVVAQTRPTLESVAAFLQSAA